jgi:predicted transcriptional regulator
MKKTKPAETTLLSRRGRRQLACKLHRREGWTMQEIGELLGISKVAVFRILRRERQAAERLRPSRPQQQPRFRRVQPMLISSVWAEL